MDEKKGFIKCIIGVEYDIIGRHDFGGEFEIGGSHE